MKILNWKSKYDLELLDRDDTLLTINFNRPFESTLARKYSKLPNSNEELLNLLQTFNPAIASVNLANYEYTIPTHVDEPLKLTDLSSGERLLTVCLMADRTKEHITVCNEIASLDMSHFRLLFKLFCNSPYIDVICPNDLFHDTLNALYKRGIAGEL